MLHRAFLVALVTSPCLFAGDAPDFLSYYNAGRETQFVLQKARAESLIADETQKKETKVYDIRRAAHAKGAVSEAELREALYEKDVATARVKLWKARIEALEGSIAHHARQADLAEKGVSDESQIDALYDEYVVQWKAQCAVFQSEISLFDAEFALAEFHVNAARKLRATKAISEEELLDWEVQLRSAEEHLKTAKMQDQDCWKDVPSIEKIKKMMDPTLKALKVKG